MTRYFYLLLIFLFILSSCATNNDKVDDVDQLFERAGNLQLRHPDSALAIYNDLLIMPLIREDESGKRLPILLEKAKVMEQLGEADSSVMILNQILSESAQCGDSSFMVSASLQLGHHYLDRGYYSLARLYYSKITHSDNTNPPTKARALNGLASASTNTGNYPEAIGQYHQAMNIFLEHGDSVNAAVQLQNLAVTYSEQGNYELADTYNNRAINVFRRFNDSTRLSDSYMNKAIFNKSSGKDSVLFFYDKAMSFFDPAKDSMRIIMINYNKAVYLIKKRPDEAKALLNKVLSFSERHNIRQGEVMALNALSDLNSTTNPALALRLARQALQKAGQSGLTNLQFRVLETVANRQTEKGIYKDAIASLRQKNDLRDSLNKDQFSKTTAELQQLFQVSELEQNNLLLLQKEEEQRQKFTTARNYGIIISIFTFIFGILLTLLLRYNKSRKLAFNALLGIYRNRLPEIVAQTPQFVTGDHVEQQKEPQENLHNDRISTWLNQLIEEEKIYCNKYLSAVEMAEKIGVSQRELSKYLHNVYGMNFATFINNHRVIYACKVIETTPDKLLKFDHIARDAGFNNRQTFYKTFHKVTGVTPGQYHKKLDNPA
jgi:tetratricopeptide (TPR) repeat protein/AraC-like DNA-binding protein